MFELEDIKNTISSYGILIIEGNLSQFDKKEQKITTTETILYAITFGSRFHTINQIMDFNFGLEMASNMAKVDSINMQSSKFFSITKNKSLVIYNNASFTTQVGEAVDYITAEVEEYPGRKSIQQLLELVNAELDFSTHIKIPLKKDLNFENMIKIIKNLNNIYRTYKEERIAIPKLAYLGSKDNDIIRRLNEKLHNDVLSENENSSISIGMYVNRSGKMEIQNRKSYK